MNKNSMKRSFKQIKVHRLLSLILIAFMLLSLLNVPGGANVVRAEGEENTEQASETDASETDAGEKCIVTWDAGDGYFNGAWNEATEEYDQIKTTTTSVEKEYYIRFIDCPHPARREGYLFIGWKTEGDNTLYIDEYDDDGNYPTDDDRDTDYRVDENITFTAQWIKNHKVTWDAGIGDFEKEWNDETEEYEIIKTHENYITDNKRISYLIKPSSLEGWAFTGWKTEGDDTLYTLNYYTSDDHPEGINYICNYVVTKDVTFIAQWEQAFEVTWDANGGEVENTKTYVAKGKCIGRIENYVEKEGCIFEGWKVKGDTTNTLYLSEKPDDEIYPEGTDYIGDYVVNGDVTFIAQWADTWKITWDAGDGNFGYERDKETHSYNYDKPIKTKTEYVKKGEKIDAGEPIYPNERDDYEFIGWKLEGDNTLYLTYESFDEENYPEGAKYIGDYLPTKDVTFTANWSKVEPVETCDVTWNSGEGILSYEEIDEEVYDYNKPIKTKTSKYEKGKALRYTPTPFRREGYIFTGWKTEGDSNLYEEKSTYEIGDEILAPEGTKFIDDYILEKDITFVAQWEEAWTVTWDGNGGNMEFNYVTDVKKGETIFRPNKGYRYSEPGYCFAGWKIAGDDTLYVCEKNENGEYPEGTSYIGDYKVNSNVTFVAYWEPGYIMTYSANGGTLRNTSGYNTFDVTIRKGGNPNDGFVPTATRKNYPFMGWIDKDTGLVYDNPLDSKSLKLSDFIPSGNVTFLARWEEVQDCTVTFKLNSDYYALYWMSDEEGNEIPVKERTYKSKSNTKIKASYALFEDLDGNENSHKFEDRFLGWKVEGSSDDVLYTTDPNAANGTTLLSLWDYVVKENVTFIAQWEKGKKVSVDVDGGYYSYYSPIDKFYDNYSAYFLSGEKISYHVSYPYKDGKLLLAWENTNTGERYTQNEFENYTVNEDVSFKAIYSDCVIVSLVINDGYYVTTGPGGVSSNATGTIKYNVNKGETPKYSKNAYNSIPAYSVYPDNNSYTFVGWKKDGDTKVYSYDELMKIKFSVDTTFYAVWEETEHNYGKLIAEKPAKCTEDGIKAHYECSLCHKLFINENDKYIEKTADELKIKAAGHKYDQKVTTKKTLKSEADCTHPAVYYLSCKCGDIGKTTFEVGNSLGHVWDKGTITVPATSTKDGVKTFHCTREGCKETKTEAESKSKAIVNVKPKISLSKTKLVYNGKAQKPKVTVKVNKKRIDTNQYTVKYSSGSKNVGAYTVTVILKETSGYRGSAKATYTIVPDTTKITKGSSSKKAQLNLTWKKQTKQISGYEIECSTSKKFNKNIKKTSAGKAKKNTTIKKLMSKKTYFVRIRTYKKIKGKKYYSKWSANKKVKVK